MKHVKGSMLIRIVKIIKADRSGVFDNLLTEEDKNLLYTTILPASWYPYDFYKRCFNALGEVYAKGGDMEICRQWGWEDVENWLIKGVYKSVLNEKNHKAAMEKTKLFFKLQFDFGEIDLRFVSDNEMVISYKNFDPDFKVFYGFVQGWNEKVLELCDCKDVTSEFLVKSWEEAGDTTLQFTWTS